MRRLTLRLLATATALLTADAALAQAADPHAGHGMAGMDGTNMSGMTPPAPARPSAGPILTLNAGTTDGPITVGGSPGQITLAFDRAMTLELVSLTNAVGQEIPLRTTLPANPVRVLTLPVVIQLPPGAYKLAWSAQEKGPHRRGQLAFVVQAADGSATPSPMMHHR